MLRGKVKEEKGKMSGPTKSTDYHQRVYEKEEFLMQTLSPAEHYVMSFQSVLVWETPSHSIALFVIVHILFWLATTLRLFYVLGVIGVIVVVTDMWKNHIWPEIRVPPSPGEEDMEGWTPVHPRLLSVPEICQYVAPVWVKTEIFATSAVNLRKKNHTKFFFVAMSIFCSTGVLGMYINGLTLMYITVLFLLLFPCFLYNNGWEKAREILEPIIANIENTMRIRRQRTKSVKRGKKRRGGEKASRSHSPTDSDSDEGLEEFVPETEAVTQETSPLVRATAESDEDEEEGDTLSLLTPPSIPSRTPSRDPSDTEEGEAGSLTPRLPNMPAYDDTLDGTLRGIDPEDGHETEGDEEEERQSEGELTRQESQDLAQALEVSTTQSKDSSSTPSPGDTDTDRGILAQQLEDEINFVTGHFSQFEGDEGTDTKDSQNGDDDDQFAQDLSGFPEVTEGDVTSNVTSETGVTSGLSLASARQTLDTVLSASQPAAGALVEKGQNLVQAVLATNPGAVTDTMSSLVAQTAAGLSSLRQSVMGGGDHDDTVTCQQGEGEFEFLNEEDLREAEEMEMDNNGVSEAPTQ